MDYGLEGMNAFDLGFLVLAGLLFLIGLLKGLTRLFVGMTALVAAFVLAAGKHAAAGAVLLARFPVSELLANVIGYVAVFVGVMILGAVAAPLVRAVVRIAMLGWADRLAGGAAGFAGAVVIAGSFVLPVVSYAPAGERLLAESHLAPYVTVGADLAAALVPEELAQEYRARMDTVRGYWEERAAGLRARRRPGPGPAAPVEVPGPSLPWR